MEMLSFFSFFIIVRLERLRASCMLHKIGQERTLGVGIRDTVLQRSRMDGNGFLGNTAVPAKSRPCSGTGEGTFLLSAMLILVRSLHTTCRDSVAFENWNMFTNAFSLLRFSCERVLGLMFSAPEGGVSNTPYAMTCTREGS
jgi:hypothetical protein